MKSKNKVAVVYRVIQGWRVPVFQRLAKTNDFKIFYGCDFKETKVVSALGPFDFEAKKMFSFPLGVRKKHGNMLLPFSPFLFFELLEFKPDVVLCEGASNFLNNISIFLYCKIFRKKMIQWGLGEIRGRKKSKVRALLDCFIVPIEKRADAIVAYSSEGGRYYENIGISREKIFIAVNVVDTDNRAEEIANFELGRCPVNTEFEDVFKVLFVGALESNKNIEMLIKSFSRLHEKHSNTELHIVGAGQYLKFLKELVQHLGISEVVFFHGRVEGPLINIVYDKDIFVMPGLGGLAVSDMLCHGIPVICSVGDGCELDLINSENGIVDDELDENSLLFYLECLINDPYRLKSMKENAKKSIETYNIDNYVSQINRAIRFSLGDMNG